MEELIPPASSMLKHSGPSRAANMNASMKKGSGYFMNQGDTIKEPESCANQASGAHPVSNRPTHQYSGGERSTILITASPCTDPIIKQHVLLRVFFFFAPSYRECGVGSRALLNDG